MSGIEVVLCCEADGCGERLVLEWPRDDYVCLIDPAIYGGGDGSLTLDGHAPVPKSATGWQVKTVRREYVVRCPGHAE